MHKKKTSSLGTMITVLVRHKVNDYAKWKTVYDEGKAMVKSKGGKSQRLFKSSSNPNELVILTQVGDLRQAQQLIQSEELKQAMQHGGVADEPTIFLLEEVEFAPL